MVTYNSNILDNTLISLDRLEVLQFVATATKQIPGAMAEVGVWRGGSSYLLCDINPNKHFYCIDTFEGIPEVDTVDLHRKGDFSISLDTVKQTLTSFLGRITFIKGRFPTDNPNLLDNETFSLVHIDVDIYTSMLECLQYFWPKMNKGGIIIMDDFFAPTTPGTTKAIMEFFNWSQIKQSALYQCYVIKE